MAIDLTSAAVLPVVSDAAHYTFQTDLDGTTFGFDIRWNERAEAWFLRLFDAEGVELLSGRRIVVGFPLIARSADPRLPTGLLIAEDTSGAQEDPGVDDLGSRVQILYFSQAA